MVNDEDNDMCEIATADKYVEEESQMKMDTQLRMKQ